jgi:hypothetical protein
VVACADVLGKPSKIKPFAFGLLSNFNTNKIISPGEVRGHKFTIDESKSGYLFARVLSIIVNNKNYDLKYILGLLNSKLVRFSKSSFDLFI